ncbi:MAG: hypothetical protein HYW50_01880, partial [Candidatus Diapherotrites archaeon]|nr:hypothetical protein [Candidatus Diapherotrites archaeon]
MQYKMTPAGKIPEYNEIDHSTWAILFERQLKLIGNWPCKEWVKGFKLLKLDPNKVPEQKKISDRLYEFTGWRIYNAVDEFLNNDEWFNALARKTFPATTYLRNHDELDFTPYPDLFHEYFGHLPYMTLPKMARIISLFPKAYFLTPPELRVGVGRLWWHAMEWQFVKENSELKVMGAGSLAGKADFLDSIKKTKIHFTINEAFNSL